MVTFFIIVGWLFILLAPFYFVSDIAHYVQRKEHEAFNKALSSRNSLPPHT